MRKIRLSSSAGIAFIGFQCICLAQEQTPKPNIVIILADDMGYSDLGCYGGEIETPNLDWLAKDGLRYRQFYNSARSCPSRAMLMTGLYPHQAGMGWMAAADMGRPEYQGSLNRECVTIAEVLKTAGYGTYICGKWHLSSDRQNNGKVLANWPNQRGFDRFYGIVDGAASYYNTTVNIDNIQEKAPDDGSFYFTHAISDTAAVFIGNHDFSEKPLFLYLAYTAPHWPLHALKSDIDKYVEKYKSGWDKLREERFSRQVAMGLFDSGTVLSPRDSTVKSWNELSVKEQEEYAMRMAIYAAQVDAMDQGVGRVVDALRQAGQLENTVIMFMSDNGACAEFISRGRKSLDGSADTYESYRINWANLSSTPYREYKHFTNEGGIATPLIVHYPNGIDKSLNGTFVDECGQFTDIMATCVELSGATYPSIYDGHEIHPMQGVSLLPNFQGGRTNRGSMFWEHEGNIAMRDGKWKIVCKTMEDTRFNKSSVKLYDMEADPTEMNDLSSEYPERLKSMYAKWQKWAESTGVLPVDTRNYGARARAYRRDHINGEFDENYGHWNIYTSPEADIRYSLDTVNTISGSKTARIEAVKVGPRPNASYLKWKFNTDKPDCVASISFKARSEDGAKIIFRVEEVAKIQDKPLDKEIFLGKKEKRFDFNQIRLPRKGQYQLVFYTGTSEGVFWIDDVRLSVTDSASE